MDAALWIAIYLPIIVALFAVWQQNKVLRLARRKKNQRKGCVRMTNELFLKCIGKLCALSTGSFGESVSGVVTAVADNWVEVETKKGVQLYNADYIMNVKILGPRPENFTR